MSLFWLVCTRWRRFRGSRTMANRHTKRRDLTQFDTGLLKTRQRLPDARKSRVKTPPFVTKRFSRRLARRLLYCFMVNGRLSPQRSHPIRRLKGEFVPIPPNAILDTSPSSIAFFYALVLVELTGGNPLSRPRGPACGDYLVTGFFLSYLAFSSFHQPFSTCWQHLCPRCRPRRQGVRS